MDSIKDLLQKYQTQKTAKYKWQDEALEAIKYFADGQANKSCIFRCFKIDSHYARIAFLESKELEKPFSKYFFKVFNSLKYENPKSLS